MKTLSKPKTQHVILACVFDVNLVLCFQVSVFFALHM
jgi:hypothetical protein